MITLPFDQLLAPLPGAQPCGEGMFFSAEFNSIQDARRFSDPSPDQGKWVTEIKETDWRVVIAESMLLLQNRTKGLRPAAWLAEASSKGCSFAGLREGYGLIAGLCERFWERLHPLPKVDDLEARTGSMAWSVTRSSRLICEAPLVEAGKGGYNLIDWGAATSLVEAIRRDPEQAGELSRGKITLEQSESARRATPSAFYKTLHDDVVGCGVALLRLEPVLDAWVGNHASSSRSMHGVLQVARVLMGRFGGRPEPKPTAAGTKGVPQQTAQSAPGTVIETVVSGSIHARAQVLNRLYDVAELFHQIEPRSLAACLVACVAEWGNVPLHAQLHTVIEDDATLSQVEELLGLGDPSSESASWAG